MADIEGIMRLIEQAVANMHTAGNLQWDSNYPNAAIFENDISRDQLWVADLDGNVAGVAAITTDQDAEYADVGWDITETAIVTHRIAVHPQYHGLGIATRLMQQAEQVATENNIAVLRVDTNSKNQATQKLFPKLGYVYAGEINLAFRPGLTFYCYEKRLR